MDHPARVPRNPLAPPEPSERPSDSPSSDTSLQRRATGLRGTTWPAGGEGQNRTADTAVFSRVLCQLSYLAASPAVPTGFEPATSTLTGWRARPGCSTGPSSCPQRGSNPCLRLERAVSWSSRRWGRARLPASSIRRRGQPKEYSRRARAPVVSPGPARRLLGTAIQSRIPGHSARAGGGAAIVLAAFDALAAPSGSRPAGRRRSGTAYRRCGSTWSSAAMHIGRGARRGRGGRERAPAAPSGPPRSIANPSDPSSSPGPEASLQPQREC
jgi:hypothetical protein